MSLSTPAPIHPGRELRDSALRQLDSAARAPNLDPGTHKFLSTPEQRSGAGEDEGVRLHAARGRVHRRGERVASTIEKRGIFP